MKLIFLISIALVKIVKIALDLYLLSEWYLGLFSYALNILTAASYFKVSKYYKDLLKSVVFYTVSKTLP